MLCVRPIRSVQGGLQRLWYRSNSGGKPMLLVIINEKTLLRRSMTTKPAGLNYRYKPKGIEPVAWVMLMAPVITFGLGTWQIKRKMWKEELIEHMHHRLHRRPVPLPMTLHEIEHLDYCPVTVTGVFDHSRELYLGPRSQVNTETHKGGGGGLISSSRAGYNVITPFKPKDRDYYILVNRGWVPYDRKNPAHRSEGQIKDEVTVTGIVRLTETRPQFMAHNNPEKNMWVYRDLDQMSEVAGTAPILIDADEDSWVPGGPIGGQTNISIRNEHLSYIVTWYSLSLATAYMWYKQYVASLGVRRFR